MKGVFLFLLCVLMIQGHPSYGEEPVKPARLAGSWYPLERGELSAMIDGFLKGAPAHSDEEIGVVISPHAGLIFSGAVAASGLSVASGREIGTVVILAPTHTMSFSGAAVWASGTFETPLGRVDVDEDLAARILSFDPSFVFRRDVFEGASGRPENSVETQVPFIQKIFPKARIVPVIMGYPPDAETIQRMSDALVAAIGDRRDVLVNVSVDQSHFHPDHEAREIDRRGIRAIEAMDIQGFFDGHASGQMEVDGFHVVATAMRYAQRAGYPKARLVRYATSADVTGDKSSVVGYASIVFSRDSDRAPSALSEAQKEELLRTARRTVETFVRTGEAPPAVSDDPRLQVREGAFVTLHKKGQLRGCIGLIQGDRPLIETVRDMAIAAASSDPRFDPVRPDELGDIDLEISVLSLPRVVRGAEEIELGRHGVIVSRGPFHRGVFLPQVATETGWSKEEFLSQLCSQKAGLPPQAWREAGTILEVFTADVFSEKK